MSIEKRAGSNLWWLDFTLAGHRRIRESTGTADFREAERVEIRRKAEVLAEPVALKGKTWGSAVIKWMEDKHPSHTELLGVQKFNRYFPDCLLTSIKPAMVDTALKKFCKNPGTYNRHRARVLGILELSGFSIKLPLKKIAEYERNWLTHEQWEKLRVELPPHMLPMATFALATGLRQANVLGLRWDHIDLGRKAMWVEAPDAKGKKAIGIPLSIEAINALLSVKGQHPEFCFTYQGHPVTEIKTAFMAACVRASVGRLSASGHYAGFTWHGFRHTFATWHFQAGTPDAVIQKLGGWKTASMLDKYRHHAVEHLASFVDNATVT